MSDVPDKKENGMDVSQVKGINLSWEELYHRLELVLHKIQSLQRRNKLLKLWKKDRSKVVLQEMTDSCVDLQIQLVDLQKDDYKALLEIKKKVISLENKAEVRVGLSSFFETFSIGYSFIIVFLMMIVLFDFDDVIADSLGVETPDKLIVFGLAGAILYLITNVLTNISNGKIKNFSKAVEILFRLILAIIVPVILVSLLFGPKGTPTKVLSPELLSFACGYSAKLVMDIFNKIVEKGSTVVEML